MNRAVLSRHGLVIPVFILQARLGSHYQKFLNKLTVTHIQKVGPPTRVFLYKKVMCTDTPCLILPRTLIVRLRGLALTFDIQLAPLHHITAPIYIEMYPNQQLIIDLLCGQVFTAERLNNGTATCILNLLAGMGKTYVAAGVIARLGLRTLFVVPKIPLANQAVKDLRECFYSDDATHPIVDLYTSRRSNISEQSITVVVINTALSLTSEFFDGYSLVILDEVHSYCSECRREIFRLATARAVFGMSATTEDRRDGFDVIAHKELAFDDIIRAEMIPGFTYEDVQFDCRARIIQYSGPSSHTLNLTHESTGKLFTHYMYNQFIDDPYRTQLAVDELIRLYDWRHEASQHFIYVFAEEIVVLTKAKEALTKGLLARQRRDIVEEIEAPELGLKMFTGGLTTQQLNDAITHGRVLFSTYPFAGTGISIKEATAMLFLTPRRANMKQILARILRRGSDTTIPRVIVDIVDKKTALRYQVGERKVSYDFYGFKQEHVKVSYLDIKLT